ncbi:MAG: hypothetical protein ABI678_25655 [Kofleriaceae bacterium]
MKPATRDDTTCPPGMDDLDLRDTRGRLRRLILAASFSLLVTTLVMRWIDSVSDAPNADPVGSSTRPLLAIAMFVVTTLVAHAAIVRITRRLRAPRSAS